MAKRLAKAQRSLMSELVDTRQASPEYREEAVDVARACRWLDRAAELYGRRRVVGMARAHYYDAFDAGVWLGYWRRYRARQDRHLIPRGVLIDAYGVADNVAMHIALSPRVPALGQAPFSSTRRARPRLAIVQKA